MSCISNKNYLLVSIALVLSCGGDSPETTSPPVLPPQGPLMSEKADPTTSLALFDLDGDGNLDLLVGNGGEPILAYLNDGSTTPFTQIPGVEISQPLEAQLQIGDLDRNGRMDIAVAQPGGPMAFSPPLVFLNPNQTSPYLEAPITLFAPPEGSGLVHPTLADVDGDGNLDLVTGHSYNTGGVWDAHYNLLAHRNLGNPPYFDPHDPTYIASAATFSSDLNDVIAADMNGDFHVDILVARGNTEFPSQMGSLIFFNDGGGGFQAPRSLIEAEKRIRDLETGDVDGDGDLDLIAVEMVHFENQIRTVWLYLNHGEGQFVNAQPLEVAALSDSAPVLFAKLGQIDDDPKPDLFLGKAGPSKILLNIDANAGASGTILLGNVMEQLQAVLFEDINGDGKSDLVLGNFGQPNQVFTSTQLLGLR